MVLPDGIAFVESGRGRVSLWREGEGVGGLAHTGGGPNGLTVGDAGVVYVAQSGIEQDTGVGAAPPSVQRFAPGGEVSLAGLGTDTVRFGGPNDLAFGPDGRLYVTDPVRDPSAPDPRGRVFALGGDGGSVVLDLGPLFPNGVGFDRDGTLVVAESVERRMLFMSADGDVETAVVLEERHAPDGFAFATDGRIFVAATHSGGIDVLGPRGETVDFIGLADDSMPTNCCFDGSVLWITDYGPDPGPYNRGGRLWRLETDAVGLDLHRGTLG